MYVWNYRLGKLERRPFKSTCYFKKMANSIQHRGPDAEGFWFSPRAAFAHRRLIVMIQKAERNRRHFVLVIIRMLLRIMEKFIISVS